MTCERNRGLFLRNGARGEESPAQKGFDQGTSPGRAEAEGIAGEGEISSAGEFFLDLFLDFLDWDPDPAFHTLVEE